MAKLRKLQGGIAIPQVKPTGSNSKVLANVRKGAEEKLKQEKFIEVVKLVHIVFDINMNKIENLEKYLIEIGNDIEFTESYKTNTKRDWTSQKWEKLENTIKNLAVTLRVEEFTSTTGGSPKRGGAKNRIVPEFTYENVEVINIPAPQQRSQAANAEAHMPNLPLEIQSVIYALTYSINKNSEVFLGNSKDLLTLLNASDMYAKFKNVEFQLKNEPTQSTLLPYTSDEATRITELKETFQVFMSFLETPRSFPDLVTKFVKSDKELSDTIKHIDDFLNTSNDDKTRLDAIKGIMQCSVDLWVPTNTYLTDTHRGINGHASSDDFGDVGSHGYFFEKAFTFIELCLHDDTQGRTYVQVLDQIQNDSVIVVEGEEVQQQMRIMNTLRDIIQRNLTQLHGYNGINHQINSKDTFKIFKEILNCLGIEAVAGKSWLQQFILGNARHILYSILTELERLLDPSTTNLQSVHDIRLNATIASTFDQEFFTKNRAFIDNVSRINLDIGMNPDSKHTHGALRYFVIRFMKIAENYLSASLHLARHYGLKNMFMNPSIWITDDNNKAVARLSIIEDYYYKSKNKSPYDIEVAYWSDGYRDRFIAPFQLFNERLNMRDRKSIEHILFQQIRKANIDVHQDNIFLADGLVMQYRTNMYMNLKFEHPLRFAFTHLFKPSNEIKERYIAKHEVLNERFNKLYSRAYDMYKGDLAPRKNNAQASRPQNISGALPELPGQPPNVPREGGKPADRVFIKGRWRKLYPQKRGFAIKYNGELVPLSKFKSRSAARG